MVSDKVKGVWKELTVALVSVVGSFLVFYMVVGRQVPTRAEVRGLIQTESPYIEDRKHIMRTLDATLHVEEKLSDALHELAKELAAMRAINELVLEEYRSRKKVDEKTD